MAFADHGGIGYSHYGSTDERMTNIPGIFQGPGVNQNFIAKG